MRMGRACGLAAAIAVAAGLHFAAGTAWAEDATQFYPGKTVRLVVGMPPGGGVDAYARLLQRHINRYLPGSPTIVAQNMPGAGSLRAVQSMATGADDGTGIVTFSSSLITESILNAERVKLDFRQFSFIGNVSEDARVCFVRTQFGANTLADLNKGAREVIFGGTQAGTSGNLDAAMLSRLLGVKLKMVQGYQGSADKKLALEKGEIDGDCGGWTSMPPNWLTDKTVNVLVRFSPTLLPGMDKSIPFGGDLVTDAGNRRVFDFLTTPQRLGRLFMVPAKVPADRVAALRAAFDKTMADKEFLAEAEKMRLTVTPLAGRDVDQQVAALYATPADLIARAKAVASE